MSALRALAANHFLETLELIGKLPVGCKPLEMAKEWDDAMSQPLDSKVAKYSKAVNRILGLPASYYLAVEYRDAKSLQGLEILKKYDVQLPDGTAEKEVEEGWDTLRTLSRHAQVACGVPAPTVPSVEEIRKDIEVHQRTKRDRRKAPDGVATMHRAFQTALVTLAEVLIAVDKRIGEGLRARVENFTDEESREACASFAARLTPPLEAAIRGKDSEFCADVEWGALSAEESECLKRSLSQPTDDLWSALEALASFSQVSKHIPTGMMAKIELTASKLAKDISSGRADMGNLDLSRIGESVLSQCSTEEMECLAGNISKLLPTLGSLQEGMNRR